MTISRLALRSAAGFTAVSLGLLACAGLASAADEPQINVRPSAGISITGLSLGAGVGGINLGVNGGVNVSLGGAVGLDLNGLDVTASVDPDLGVSIGVNALDGAVDADASVDLDGPDLDITVGIGDGDQAAKIRKAAEAKVAQRQAAKAKATAKPRDGAPQINVRPTAGLSITGLNAGAGVGGVQAVVVGGANINAGCGAGVGTNGGITAGVSCDADAGVSLGASLDTGDSRKAKAESIRKAAEAKIAKRAAK